MPNKKTYETRHRATLLEYLHKNSNRCLTAREIITEAHLPLGEATVYRLLAKLNAEGKLKKFTDDSSGAAKYKLSDEGCERHYHLHCLACGDTICADNPIIIELASKLRHDYGFTLDGTKTVLYGLCNSCAGTTDAEAKKR